MSKGLRALSVVIAAALLAGCGGAPGPDTAAGRADQTKQQCAICVLQNPGDSTACYAVCQQAGDADQAYARSIGR